MMKRIKLNISARIIVVAFAVTTLFASCKKNDEEIVYGNAKFKLVNAVQGSAAQDFYQGDTKLSTTAIAYGEVSDNLTLKAGQSVVSFKPTGSQEVSATGNISINTDVNYTVFYVKNSTGSGEITGYPQTNGQPPVGRAGVRFVNLGVGLASTIVVSFGNNEPITTGLPYRNATDYAIVDPAVELKFSLSSALDLSTPIPASTFQSGKLYTVWFDATNTTTAQYHVVAEN